MKIYTRRGDKGKTSLFTGDHVLKNDPIIEALGTVDECSSAIGVALSMLPKNGTFSEMQNELQTIQKALFDVGAALATPKTWGTPKQIRQTHFNPKATTLIEEWIDTMQKTLQPLTHFILPGGHSSAAMLHFARTICRRAERNILLVNHHADVSDNVMMYLNRLGDYLFVAARYINHLQKTPETTWEHQM